MPKSPLRSIGSQVVSAAVGAAVAVVLVGGGFAFAQEAPATGEAVAEVAAANSVDSAAIINGTVTGTDIANGTIGRNDLKPRVAARWAQINGGGVNDTVLVRGRGVESAFHGDSPGQYRVVFSDQITNCGWTAALNDVPIPPALGGNSSPGQISVQGSSQANTDLIVRTYNTAGTPADTAPNDGFTVTVDC